MAHRAQLYSSKICKKAENERNRRIHLQRLRNVRPSLDNSAPKTMRMRHMQRNWKKEALQEERLTLIERQNRQLVDRMTSIMRRPQNAGDLFGSGAVGHRGSTRSQYCSFAMRSR